MINKIHRGDALSLLVEIPDNSVDCVVTSPPYWLLRNYQNDLQLGQEGAIEDYIDNQISVIKELKRILNDYGLIFWNHGNSYLYNGLTMQNYRLMIKAADELNLKIVNEIIWEKTNAMPMSGKKLQIRHEPVFILAKTKDYWFDLDAVRVPYTESTMKCVGKERTKFGTDVDGNIGKVSEGAVTGETTINEMGKNPGNIWKIATAGFSAQKYGGKEHYASFPEKLVDTCLRLGCAKEICPKCKKPRERIIVDKTVVPMRNVGTPHIVGDGNGCRGNKYTFDWNVTLKKTDWSTCSCGVPFRKGIVLDPYMGTGTTALVAKKMCLDYIGIELNPDWVDMAHRRLDMEVGLLNHQDKEE